MNVCICFRGELLRCPRSSHYQTRNIVADYDFSDENINRQNDIMQSIINHIIIPYENKGYNVFISGCVYKCPHYDEQLKKFFPNNTIKQIEPGKTGQVQIFKQGMLNAIEQHPDCEEYISLRADYIMLQDIVFKEKKEKDEDYIGIAWSNMGSEFPPCDVFFVISKNIISQFIEILWRTGYSDCHYIIEAIRKRKIPLYPVWEKTYRRASTPMSYTQYIEKFDIHKYRPLANYMRDDALHPRNTHLKPGRLAVPQNIELK